MICEPISCMIVFVIMSCLKTVEVNSYSKVTKSGASNNETAKYDDGPKVHRAFNVDLIFPKVFNTTEDRTVVVSTEKTESTGRATKYSGPFQFSAFNPNLRRPPPRTQPYPQVKLRPSVSYPVYAPQSPNRAEIDKLKGKGQAMDRYTPGEAVATSYYKGNNKGGYMYKAPPKQESVPTYSAPKDLYSFPPNIDSNYSPPSSDLTISKPQSEVSSYLPPAAGPASSYGAFIGPVNPEYLPTHLKNPPVESDMSKDNRIKPGANVNSEDSASIMHEGNDQTPPPDVMESPEQDHPPPQDEDNSDMMRGPIPMDNPPFPDHEHIPDDDHDHIPNDHSHEYHGPWDSLPNFFGGHDAYPEIIYDDHHHHHHHPHPPQIVTTTTTERPEPRVKKYSYFYLGRKLWYIPLYFTVWFSFYILFLILKSIARHKVNLPNHYQRSMMKRSLLQDINHKGSVERVNRLTASVMAQIEAFKKKYL